MLRPRVLIVLAALLAAGAGAAAAPAHPPVYRGAIVLDAADGRVLFESGADEVSPPASMAKLMTYAVLEDQIRAGKLGLGTVIAVTPADARAAAAMRGGTNVALKAGEAFTVEEMIYAMMIQSANDAASTVARAVAGSVDAFVTMMNAKAAALGMTRTRFRTPNGFPAPSRRIADGDLTTPRDFAALGRYLILHTDILRYTSVRTRAFGSGKRFPATIMTNHNHLLGKIDGVDGLKTGFTNGAGFCLAATAKRGERRIIVVMMDCPDTRSRDVEVARLIERGFVSLPAFKAPALGSAGAAPAAPSRPAAPAANPFFSLPR